MIVNDIAAVLQIARPLGWSVIVRQAGWREHISVVTTEPLPAEVKNFIRDRIVRERVPAYIGVVLTFSRRKGDA